MGEEGQQKLLNSKVLVIGAGGLGSPASLYLAASGIGEIILLDDDNVDLSNLQRQILFETSDINRPKVDAAKDALEDLNPDISVKSISKRLTEELADGLFQQVDIVLDGSDNIATRYLSNDYALKYNKTLISGAVQGVEGQLMVIKNDHPCYRCTYPDIDDSCLNCAELGILSPVAGIVGSLMAQHAITEALGIGESLAGELLIYKALENNFRKVKLNKEPNCICSSKNAKN